MQLLGCLALVSGAPCFLRAIELKEDPRSWYQLEVLGTGFNAKPLTNWLVTLDESSSLSRLQLPHG
jgi:hypothetical protein